MTSVAAILPIPASANSAPSAAAQSADDDFRAVLASYTPMQDLAAANDVAKNDAPRAQAVAKNDSSIPQTTVAQGAKRAEPDPVIRAVDSDLGLDGAKKTARDGKSDSAKLSDADIQLPQQNNVQAQPTILAASYIVSTILQDKTAANLPAVANSDDVDGIDAADSSDAQAIPIEIDASFAGLGNIGPHNALPASAAQSASDDVKHSFDGKQIADASKPPRETQAASDANPKAKSLPQRAMDAIVAIAKSAAQPLQSVASQTLQTSQLDRTSIAATSKSAAQSGPTTSAPQISQPAQVRVTTMLNAMRGATAVSRSPKEVDEPSAQSVSKLSADTSAASPKSTVLMKSAIACGDLARAENTAANEVRSDDVSMKDAAKPSLETTNTSPNSSALIKRAIASGDLSQSADIEVGRAHTDKAPKKSASKSVADTSRVSPKPTTIFNASVTSDNRARTVNLETDALASEHLLSMATAAQDFYESVLTKQDVATVYSTESTQKLNELTPVKQDVVTASNFESAQEPNRPAPFKQDVAIASSAESMHESNELAPVKQSAATVSDTEVVQETNKPILIKQNIVTASTAESMQEPNRPAPVKQNAPTISGPAPLQDSNKAVPIKQSAAAVSRVQSIQNSGETASNIADVLDAVTAQVPVKPLVAAPNAKVVSKPDSRVPVPDEHDTAPANPLASDKGVPSQTAAQPATVAPHPSATTVPVITLNAMNNSIIAVAQRGAPASPTHIPQDVQPNIAALATAIAAKSSGGMKTFDIRMDPPDLGRVDVHMSVDRDGKVQATLSVEHPQTLELLQRDSQSLERALKDSGLNLSNNSLNFSLKGEGQHNDGGGAFLARTRSLPDAVVARAEAANASLSNFNFTSGNGRLDIRV